MSNSLRMVAGSDRFKDMQRRRMACLFRSSHKVLDAICHVFGGIKHKAKVFVLTMARHSCALKTNSLQSHLGFKDQNLCFAEVDCELELFTKAGQCIQLPLEPFWPSGHRKEVIDIQQ